MASGRARTLVLNEEAYVLPPFCIPLEPHVKASRKCGNLECDLTQSKAGEISSKGVRTYRGTTQIDHLLAIDGSYCLTWLASDRLDMQSASR